MARWMVSNLICLHCSARSCLAVSIEAHIGFVVSPLLAVVHCWTELVCAVMHLSVDNSGRRYTWGCWNGREMQTLPGGDRERERVEEENIGDYQPQRRHHRMLSWRGARVVKVASVSSSSLLEKTGFSLPNAVTVQMATFWKDWQHTPVNTTVSLSLSLFLWCC